MANQTFCISGRVIDRQTRCGVKALRIEAWDKDLICDDLVGFAITDESGGFQMEFDESYFRELFPHRKPDLFFRVFSEGRLIKSTEDSVLWNVEAGLTETVIEVDSPCIINKEEERKMLSYICEFNLNLAGEEAEKYLTSIVREWSALYAELSGVRGTLFLANAFGLAGEYTYLYRVDMESIKTLQVIDDAIKSDDARWRNARAEWFGIRTGVRARLLRLDSVTPGYCSQSSGARDGLIHYVLTYGSGGHGREQVLANRELKDRLPEIWGTLKGVSTLQHFTAAVRSFNGGRHEVWARLADLSALEEVYQANDTHLGEILKAGSIITSLYGEMREVDGSLLIGA